MFRKLVRCGLDCLALSRSLSSKAIMTDNLVVRLLASSVTAANRAGKIIRDILSRGDLGIVEKGVNDLQTEADRSAQRCIIASLSLKFPGVTIIGEEGSGTSGPEVPSDWLVTDSDPAVLQLACPSDLIDVRSTDIVVWVDPLDGTADYTQGLVEHVTVLIGVCVRGKAVAGVIHQPYYQASSSSSSSSEPGRTLWGLVGAGVGGFRATPPPADSLIVTTTRSHSDHVVQAAIDALQPTQVLRVSGAGHKVLLLLDGRAHAYVFASAGCKKWDTCGPEAVLRAAGGRLTTLHGRCYNYSADVSRPNQHGVLATAPGVDYDLLRKRIPSSVLHALHCD